MQVHALPPASRDPPGPLRQHAPRLIELCGTPKFEGALFHAAREAASCEHVTAFASCDTGPPRIMIAANTSALPVARQVAQKYVRDYWQLDPVRTVGPPKAAGGGNYAIRVHSADIDYCAYRQECYTAVGLHDRISLITPRNHETLRLNFYKSAKAGRFTAEELDHILEASDLILSLLAKHDAVAPPRGGDLTLMFQRRLQIMAPPLPRREMEVCTLIATGMSSEGIALQLGVSLNTVLTHRKRAYSRLGISSQNELLRLLLS